MIYNLCIFADSTYPAAMPHSVVFNLGPHCLHKYPLTNIVDPNGSKKYLTEIFLKKMHTCKRIIHGLPFNKPIK